MERQFLVALHNVSVRLAERQVLSDIEWSLRPGEHWAVLGGNCAGKTTFLKLVRGELWPAPGRGERIYRLDAAEQRTAVGVKEQMPLISPEAQERYLQIEWKLRARDVIYSGFRGTDYLYQSPTPEQRKRTTDTIALLGIGSLVRREVQSLSTGELRRVLIARALVARPRVLLLDEVCDGLDAPARRRLLSILDCIAQSGTQIIYTTHRTDEFIPAITHALVLKNGRITWRGSARELSQRRYELRRPAYRGFGGASAVEPANSKALLRVENADVYLGRKRALRDIVWQMEEGQNWAVFGANGSGKTTFVKLLCGDVHPASGGHVLRFDFTPQNTLWDIRQRIGFISPALQASYREQLTGAEVVASGFFASIGLLDGLTRTQRRRVGELFEIFGVRHLAKLPALKMSYGEFRKILLLRALVHNPAIVVCDEPFDGLDAEARKTFCAALDHVAKNGTRLITVTHHTTDLPKSVTHALVLEKGRIVCQGALGKVQQHRAMRCLFGDERQVSRFEWRADRALSRPL